MMLTDVARGGSCSGGGGILTTSSAEVVRAAITRRFGWMPQCVHEASAQAAAREKGGRIARAHMCEAEKKRKFHESLSTQVLRRTQRNDCL